MPSLARLPVAPVLLRRSEPAKSTKWNFAVKVCISFSFTLDWDSLATYFCLIFSVKMACDRLDWEFILVANQLSNESVELSSEQDGEAVGEPGDNEIINTFTSKLAHTAYLNNHWINLKFITYPHGRLLFLHDDVQNQQSKNDRVVFHNFVRLF